MSLSLNASFACARAECVCVYVSVSFSESGGLCGEVGVSLAVCQGLHCCLFFLCLSKCTLVLQWVCLTGAQVDLCPGKECGTEGGLVHKQLFIPPSCVLAAGGRHHHLEARPSADLTNMVPPSPPTRYSAERHPPTPSSGASATRVSTSESGRCGAQPSPVGSGEARVAQRV